MPGLEAVAELDHERAGIEMVREAIRFELEFADRATTAGFHFHDDAVRGEGAGEVEGDVVLARQPADLLELGDREELRAAELEAVVVVVAAERAAAD